jgi:phosphatidylglycerophosphate synthase
VILTLAAEGELEWWWVVLLAARDIAVVLATLVLFHRHRMEASHHMSHHVSGKIATAAAFVLLVALLAWPRHDALHWALLSVAAGTSLFAGARVFVRLPDMLRGETGELTPVASTNPLPTSSVD